MKYEHMTDLQKTAFNEAKKVLEQKSWFKGVCTDGFPTHADCENNFDNAVQSIVSETTSWDAP